MLDRARATNLKVAGAKAKKVGAMDSYLLLQLSNYLLRKKMGGGGIFGGGAGPVIYVNFDENLKNFGGKKKFRRVKKGNTFCKLLLFST